VLRPAAFSAGRVGGERLRQPKPAPYLVSKSSARLVGAFFANVMKSLVIKRSIVLAGHKTNVSIEDKFWNGMKEIARQRHVTVSHGIVDTQRQPAIFHRLFGCSCLEFYCNQVS
jgi:Ribbon-helix-helix domain